MRQHTLGEFYGILRNLFSVCVPFRPINIISFFVLIKAGIFMLIHQNYVIMDIYFNFSGIVGIVCIVMLFAFLFELNLIGEHF